LPVPRSVLPPDQPSSRAKLSTRRVARSSARLDERGRRGESTSNARALAAGAAAQAVDGVAAAVGGGLPLPHLRHRRHPGPSPAAHVSRPPVSAESRLSAYRTYSSRPCWSPHAPRRTRVTSPWSSCSACSGCEPRSVRCQHRWPRRGARPPRPARGGQGTKVVLVPLPSAVGRAIDRAVGDRTAGADPARWGRHPHGPQRRHPKAQAPRRRGRGADTSDAPAHC